MSLEINQTLGRLIRKHERVNVFEGIYTTGEHLGINAGKYIVSDKMIS